MHRDHENPAPEPLDNAATFHDLGRRDHEGRAGTGAVRPILIEHRSVRWHSRQRLELPVRHVLQGQQSSVELLSPLAALSALIGPLGGHDGHDRGVGPIHCVLDHEREVADADPTVGEDLALVERNGAGLRLLGIIL